MLSTIVSDMIALAHTFAAAGRGEVPTIGIPRPGSGKVLAVSADRIATLRIVGTDRARVTIISRDPIPALVVAPEVLPIGAAIGRALAHTMG